ncbi:MAG: hypothetical protein QM811_00480 [Pirellulales bacterium]
MSNRKASGARPANWGTAVLATACLWLVGCERSNGALRGDYDAPREWATIQVDKMFESSGLAVGTFGDEELLWTNVDGPSGRFYLVDAQGKFARNAF